MAPVAPTAARPRAAVLRRWSSLLAQGCADAARLPFIAWFFPDEPVRLLRPDGSEAIILGDTDVTARSGVRPAVAAVELPADLILERQVILHPDMTDHDCEQALAIEVSEVCPFGEDDVTWGWRWVETEEVGHRRAARLVMASLSRARSWLHECQNQHAWLATAKPEVWANGLPPIVLRGFGEELRARGKRKSAWLGLAMFSASVLLALSLALSPVWQERQRLVSANLAFDAIKARASDAVRARDALNAANERIDAIAADLSQAPAALDLLAILTDLLPDDVVLTQLDLVRGGAVRMAAEALNASSVMELIERHPLLSSPRSVSPTRRNVKTGRESLVVEFTYVRMGAGE